MENKEKHSYNVARMLIEEQIVDANDWMREWVVMTLIALLLVILTFFFTRTITITLVIAFIVLAIAGVNLFIRERRAIHRLFYIGKDFGVRVGRRYYK